MIYDVKHSTSVVDELRTNGVLVYVNTGRTEPMYIAGPGRPATFEDVSAAINFLTVLYDLMKAGEA
jgi:hypothetical protein